MRTLDLTLLIPETDEITMCYKMGLKSIKINSNSFPVFAIRSDTKDVFLERLKDEFGTDIHINDITNTVVDKKAGIIDIIYYNEFLKG
jgi:hypothetical protein